MEQAELLAVKTEIFEGPLELLVELCEKRKLLINDISLATVTDDYINQVSLMQADSLPHTAQFIQLAATLLLIKSKSLLPTLELSAEEETDIKDLQERLQKYAIYREAGQELTRLFGSARLHAPERSPITKTVFAPDGWCTVDKLSAVMQQLLTDLPVPTERQEATVKEVISLETMISRLQKRINDQARLTFRELCFSDPNDSPRTRIVSFLAVLELFRDGNLLLRQRANFADIEIERDRGHTPTYY